MGSNIIAPAMSASKATSPELRPGQPMPWAVIDGMGDPVFVPGGREQPDMPEDRVVFEP